MLPSTSGGQVMGIISEDVQTIQRSSTCSSLNEVFFFFFSPARIVIQRRWLALNRWQPGIRHVMAPTATLQLVR